MVEQGARPGADSRYPLRVERHMGRLVDGLLPGVITTTTHARAHALHTLNRTEAARRELDVSEANALMRRCEVVIGAITLLHGHDTTIPGAHGADHIEKSLKADGRLHVGDVAKRYTANEIGFGGVYLGSEIRLGLLTSTDRARAAGE
ncbi:MAG: hypothetical protein R3C15_15780 [Thermoleophilia bacterium]